MIPVYAILIFVIAVTAVGLLVNFYRLKRKEIMLFLEANGYRRLDRPGKEAAGIAEELLGSGSFGMVMESGRKDNFSLIFEFRGGHDTAPLNTYILSSVIGRDFMTIAGDKQNFDVSKYFKGGSLLEKMLTSARLRTNVFKFLKPISDEEQLNVDMRQFLIMKVDNCNLLNNLPPEQLRVLREWAENDMAGFLFHKNYCLIRIGADASQREGFRNFFMSGQRNISRWRKHLEMNERLLNSMDKTGSAGRS